MADKVETIDGTNLVVIDGVQYKRAYAEARGLIKPAKTAERTEGAEPSGTRARTSASAATGKAGTKPPVTSGAAAGDAPAGAVPEGTTPASDAGKA